MNCPGCDKPMIDGQVFNGLYGCHWGCTDKVRNDERDERAAETISNRVESDAARARKLVNGMYPLDGVKLSCAHDPSDTVVVECFTGKDRVIETVSIESNTTDGVHLNRESATVLHVLLGRFLDATK